MEFFTNDFQLNLVNIRREQRQGREFLVVPVVAAVESVMNGRLVLSQELEKSAMSLNGRPITIGHPQNQTGFIPANSPDVQSIGKVFDAHIDGDALKANAWFDVELVRKAGVLGKRILDAINAKEILEVSLGWFSDAVAQAGTFQSNTYNEIVQNLQHDHLAVLLDTEGACSINDGCGLVRNEAEEETEDKQFNYVANIVKNVLATLGISHNSKEIEPMADQEESTVVNNNDEVLAAITGLQESFNKQVQELNGRIDEIQANAANAEKAPIVARLIANERCSLGEESLNAMSACDLKKLEGDLKPRNYSGAAGNFFANVESNDEFKYVEVE